MFDPEIQVLIPKGVKKPIGIGLNQALIGMAASKRRAVMNGQPEPVVHMVR